jgi:hypothetical protein
MKHGALRDLAVDLRGADLRAQYSRPDEPVRSAARNELRHAADRSIANKRAEVVAARGEPEIGAERDLKGIKIAAEEAEARADSDITDLGRGRGREGAGRRGGAVAGLEDRSRDVDVYSDAAEEGEGARDMEEELIANDSAGRAAGVARLGNEGVMSVIAEEHDVEGALASNERRRDAEEAITRRGWIEALEGDAALRRRGSRE